MSMSSTVIRVTGNGTICQEMPKAISGVLWHSGNPLEAPFALFLLQLSVISVVSQLFDLFLKHIGQSSIMSQILGGVIFGPSMLGHIKVFSENFFPTGSIINLKVAAIFGLMFFLFTVSVKLDPTMILRSGRKAVVMGFSLFIFTSTFTVGLAFIFVKFIPMESSLSDSLLYLAATQTISSCPVVATLLTELKILNTDIGQLALSSSMFCDVLGISLTIIAFSVFISKERSVVTMICALSSAIALFATIIFILRPIILWMLNNSTEDKPVNQKYIFSIFIFVLVIGFLGEVVGQHYLFGPLILGFVVPDGPPLGAAIVSKLETFFARMLYPVYLALSGLETNVFKIQLQSMWIVGILVLFASIVKIGAVMLPAAYSNVTRQDALVLGLILNSKGFFEVIVFNVLKQDQILTEEDFSLAILSVLVVSGIITPLVKYLYDPSIRYIPINRSTIQHANPDSELRILVCIHNHESIPTIINLLEVSHATESSPVAATALILVELVGRSAPILVANEIEGHSESNTSTTSCVGNALRLYENHNQGRATVQSFTSICLFETMHNDVYRVAREKRAMIIILPFHRQGAIDGSDRAINPAIKNLNLKILQKAPCSVGILIDRGMLTGSLCVLTSQVLFHVASVFIGGPDDVESLAYASRMARHQCVRLTVIRFLLFGAENTKDRKQDCDLINEYRRINIGNKNFEYLEEIVRDGAGLAASLIGFADDFDLILVGKSHQESQIFAGLEAWSECPEVGVIGDMLASPDFGRRASVLVVRQQRVGGKLMHRNMQPVVTDRDSVVHDVPYNEASRLENNYTPSISIDRN